MVMQIREPESAGEEPGVPLTVFISTDLAERARIAQTLDPYGVVILAPDRETAARLLSAAASAVRPVAAPQDGEQDGKDREVIALGDLVIDPDRASVTWSGTRLELTHLEIEVLACLARTPGRVWSYERLHRAAWRSDYLGDRDSLHSLMKRLRRKLRSAGVTIDLHAVRGIGFQIVPMLSMANWELPI